MRPKPKVRFLLSILNDLIFHKGNDNIADSNRRDGYSSEEFQVETRECSCWSRVGQVVMFSNSLLLINAPYYLLTCEAKAQWCDDSVCHRIFRQSYWWGQKNFSIEQEKIFLSWVFFSNTCFIQTLIRQTLTSSLIILLFFLSLYLPFLPILFLKIKEMTISSSIAILRSNYKS